MSKLGARRKVRKTLTQYFWKKTFKKYACVEQISSICEGVPATSAPVERILVVGESCSYNRRI